MPDVDQQAAFAALHEQAGRCLALLEAIGRANNRIVQRASSGDPVWARVAASRYNHACRERTGNEPATDPYLQVIRADPDLKAVCDNRWLLGEAVDVLGSRHQRLDTIAAPFEDLERCIRKSVTEVDRSPEELAQALEAACLAAKRALAWRPPQRDDGPTLADRWIRRLKNHPIGAAIFIAALVIAAAAAILSNLSRSWPLGASTTPPPAPAGASSSR